MVVLQAGRGCEWHKLVFVFLNKVDGGLWIDIRLKNSVEITSMLVKRIASGKDKPKDKYGSNKLL